jgi:hypothetical protein
LNNVCRKRGARENPPTLPPETGPEITGLPKPPHWVIDKIRADISAGELDLHDIESFNDQPIARGVGDTATEAVETMWP